MELKNYTPHTITIFRAEDSVDMGRGVYKLRTGAEPILTLESQGVSRATVNE